MWVNGGRTSVWGSLVSLNCNTAVGAWENRWCDIDCPGASACRCISARVDTLFVRFVKEAGNGNVLGKLPTRRELVMFEIPLVIKLTRFRRLFESFLSPSKLDSWEARG